MKICIDLTTPQEFYDTEIINLGKEISSYMDTITDRTKDYYDIPLTKNYADFVYTIIVKEYYYKGFQIELPDPEQMILGIYPIRK